MPKILPDLKQRLLAQVQSLLEEGGYAAVTIRSVAAGCGVGVGTVYNYFPSKEALLAEYLLLDWRSCIAAMENTQAQGAKAVAQSIHRELTAFSSRHQAIFQEEAARTAFAGSFSQYHALLRSQLAAPLRPWCQSGFAADFLAEALLTWTVAGTDFETLWGMLAPLFGPL